MLQSQEEDVQVHKDNGEWAKMEEAMEHAKSCQESIGNQTTINNDVYTIVDIWEKKILPLFESLGSSGCHTPAPRQ